MKIFGERLRELRKQKELSQEELGKDLLGSLNTVSAWELDKQEPNLDMVVVISIYFDVSLDFLLGKTEF